MNISELIYKLEELRATYGEDLPVILRDLEDWETEIDDIIFNRGEWTPDEIVIRYSDARKASFRTK